MLTKNTDLLKSEIAHHIAADAVVQGDYWRGAKNAVGGRGCFIGCLAHSEDARILGEKYGLPLMLVKVCENIFEGLPEDDAKDFFAQIGDAVGCDGKDLTRVVWAFLGSELRNIPGADCTAISDVIAGMDLLAAGEKWPDAYAAYAAAYAAYAAIAADAAARAAYAAADAAAYAAIAAGAAHAAHAAYIAACAAAYDAARQRQKDTILKLIREAS
jgi:hypothetical protein